MQLSERRFVLPVLGVVAVLLGLAASVTHERAAVAWRQAQTVHGGSVRVLDADTAIDSIPDGHMVLVTGRPDVRQKARDPQFGMRVDSPTLVRNVRMFQWREQTLRGQPVYSLEWVDHAVDSDAFQQPDGHANKAGFPLRHKRFRASRVQLHGLTLDDSLVKALPTPAEPVEPDPSALPANLQASFTPHDGALVSSADPGYPQPGDLRVSWRAVPRDTVTVVAQLRNGHLQPASRAPDGTGFRVQLGVRDLRAIYPDLPPRPHGLWWWRLLALVLIGAGTWCLLGYRTQGRGRLPLAAASALGVVGLVTGSVWLTTAVLPAALGWGIAVLAGVGCWRLWRMPS